MNSSIDRSAGTGRSGPMPAGKSRQLFEKKRICELAHSGKQTIPFAEIAHHPLFQAIADRQRDDGFKADLKRFNFNNAAEAVAFAAGAGRRNRAINLQQFSGGAAEAALPKLPRPFLARARREAIRTWRSMQHLLSVKDPMNIGLRHTPSRLPEPLEQAYSQAGNQAFANPSSLQSDQSVAAYLSYLYRIAHGLDDEIGLIEPETQSDRLSHRRPDLARLTLSEANLKREIPAIGIINEVLDSGLGDIDFERSFFPIALPFNAAMAAARAALSKIGGTTLNMIHGETLASRFPLRPGFSLSADTAGLLGLSGSSDMPAEAGSVLSLLSEDSAAGGGVPPSTAQDLFGVSGIELTGHIAFLRKSLDLDFDALMQMLGLYAVSQEDGEPVAQVDYATSFFDNPTDFVLLAAGDDQTVYCDGGPLTAPYLRSMHYLARLHHATDLPFHQLNLLLSIPGARIPMDPVADPDRVARCCISKTGLRLLASYRVYHDAFGLSPEAFQALFDTICPFWRADAILEGQEQVTAGLEQTETSFMRALFGQDAPYVLATITKKATPISDPRLSAAVQNGLRISAIELDVLVQALSGSFALQEAVDARGLGALYRLSAFFRMLGWPLTSGLELAARVSSQFMQGDPLFQALTACNMNGDQTDQLLTALDQLTTLAQWMASVELSPENLLALIIPGAQTGRRASEKDLEWLAALAKAAATSLIAERTFTEFEIWDTVDGRTTLLPASGWHADLRDRAGLYHGSGVLTAAYDGAVFDEEIRGFIAAYPEIDLDSGRNHRQIARLVSRLERLRDAQIDAIERQVATLGNALKPAGAGALIVWAQTDPFSVLETLLAGADNDAALFWLAELRRYAAADDALRLGDIALELIGFMPQWIAPGLGHGDDGIMLAGPLDLEQLFYLSCFGRLQAGAAGDAAWRGYLAMAKDAQPGPDMPGDQAAALRQACMQTLAILLECPPDDIKAYCADMFGDDALADDIARLDALSRHVRLAERLHISARDLLALKAVSHSGQRGDWSTAETAARAGLAQFEDGDHVAAFENALAEDRRDALVAAFMQTNIARDPVLCDRVIDREALYRHLLLDVQVTSAVPTSRLVEAMSSLQLYITRALNGLEKGVGFVNREALAARWQLDRTYRHWEANAKLARYPQNYIEPELRYETSPEFDALLQSISGSDLDETGAETAVNTYMAGLANVCALSVCSFYVEPKDEAGGGPTYHFLAAADWEPGRFFYRKMEADFAAIAALSGGAGYLKALDWTFWEEVEVPATHELLSDIAVCVFENRYFFFWLEIEERKAQGPENKEAVWRIHPRYMRCDANALTGPKYTPGLFTEGELQGAGGVLSIDGAFEWTGARPAVSTLYHPMTATGLCQYGVPASRATPQGALKTAIYVTIGIDLQETGSSGALHQSSMQIRLTDDWVDGIFYPEQPVDLRMQEAAPAQFTCVHPQIAMSMIEGDHMIETDNDIFLQHMWIRSTTSGVYATGMLVEIWSGNSPRATYRLPAVNSANIGTIETGFGEDFRSHYLIAQPHANTDKSGFFTDIFTERAAETYLQTVLTIEDEEISPKTVTGERVGGKDTLWYSKSAPNLPFAETNHEIYESANERRKSSVAVPESWMVKLGESRKIKVKLKVNRPMGQYFFDWYTVKTHQNGRLFLPYDSYKLDTEVEIGTFTLRLSFGKVNTVWTQNDTHSSRNFVHLVENDSTKIEDTYLILNSSSALAELARKMPRPGDFPGLFTLENQALSEKLGSFPTDFTQTLAELYGSDDTTRLPETSLPEARFDFDASHGGYGWEIFYHIPTALAASYADNGQFDAALNWLERIYNPKLSAPWQVLPLAGAEMPEGESAFDTGDVIVDPDRLAADYPFYYQQATIRHYIETMLAAGDALYHEETQESLQQAKSLYVEARQLFADNLEEILEVVTAQPWRNPTLGAVAEARTPVFLPPYNRELRDLYDLIGARLNNLRQWLDIDGKPLNIPLLSAVIDPRQLQMAAKTALRKTPAETRAEELEPLIDFTTIARATRHYIANLKTTSSRLQAAKEKADGFTMAQTARTNARDSLTRAIALQGLAIDVARTEKDVKTANVAAKVSALRNEVQINMLQYYVTALEARIREGKAAWEQTRVGFENKVADMRARIEGRLPTIMGTSAGGAPYAIVNAQRPLHAVGHLLSMQITSARAQYNEERKAKKDQIISDIAKLTSELAAASLEQEKARQALKKEEAQRDNLRRDRDAADALVALGDTAFGTDRFYNWLAGDLENLFDDEFAVTLELCKLLAHAYEDETGQTNGTSFINTTNPGDSNERFNAPYRLALDVERLELAYVTALMDPQSAAASLTFSLSALPALNGQVSAHEALVASGEAYFELGEDMFEVLYPGQYDRRIQSIAVHFPGLEKAGLSPHGRLTQIANTRYLTRERQTERGGRIRRNRHALQSIMLAEARVDTARFDYPEGMLRRFQNTGVESRWHLVLPALQALRSGRHPQSHTRAWQDAATRHMEILTPALDDVTITVTFSGRW
ncbi:toxin complex protein [Martelella alba]|uniref:Toxin complex protein n=1 Tax=Martelella alba TaxID=2590451 RepID=A0A506U2C3_9HYPH|nr:neuraminidase-like domain-containing protein [Martelella alba]TPW27618.1 toxin complex protein [Martelella alba]